jgi:hypothetical protein
MLFFITVSKGENFSEMFACCSSLQNLDAFKNYNVSNGIGFMCMLSGCSSIQNVDGLINWNVSNAQYFGYGNWTRGMFSFYTS